MEPGELEEFCDSAGMHRRVGDAEETAEEMEGGPTPEYGSTFISLRAHP
jgi:hypothetical protein